MFTTEMILRLRHKCPLFQSRVGGMAAFDKATAEDVSYDLPYAFVIPVEENADPAEGNSSAQLMTQRFILVVVLDNSTEKEDGRGMTARTSLDIARREFLNALLGWEPVSWSVPVPKVPVGYEEFAPNSRADTLRYQGYSLIKMTDSRAWYQFEFTTHYYDSATGQQEVDRHQSTVTLANGSGVVVDQSMPTASTAHVNYAVDSEGKRLPNTWYTFVPSTGVFNLSAAGKAALGVTPTITTMFEIATPKYFEIVRQVYAQYYPELMEMAGGDPANITPDMYKKISDVPPDALIVWEPVSTQDEPYSPAAHWGGTPKAVTE